MIASFLTSVLVLGCGYADFVYQDIVSRMGVRSESQFVRPGTQGERVRRVYLYSDGSWFMTFEYPHATSAAKDVSCLVAVGSREQFEDVLSFQAKELPAQQIGPDFPRPTLP